MQLPLVVLPGVLYESRRLSLFLPEGVSKVAGISLVIYWFDMGDVNTDCLFLIIWAKIWCLLAITF